jgi:DNA-binding NarL/FixJ family response regulator
MADTSLLLVDDHAVLRSGLRVLIDREAGLEVVGEAGDGREAVGLARDLKPDGILLDLSMPGLSGVEAMGALREVSPESRILVLSMHVEDSYLRSALRAGAAGYVPKKAADVELVSAIRAVVRGEVYVHPAMTGSLVEGLIPPETAAPRNEGEVWEALSGREREVLHLVALGHTNLEIADRLSLSEKTVEAYRARGIKKLGIRNRAALVKYALKHGLLIE